MKLFRKPSDYGVTALFLVLGLLVTAVGRGIYKNATYVPKYPRRTPVVIVNHKISGFVREFQLKNGYWVEYLDKNGIIQVFNCRESDLELKK